MEEKDKFKFNSSGKQREFSSGSVRDFAADKSPMQLLPLDLLMERVAPWYGLGAAKYGANNWRLGQPQSEVLGSLLRHLTKYIMGKKDEDHLAAVVWNALCLLDADQNHKDDKSICDIGDK